MELSETEVARMVKMLTTSQLMREVRRRQVSKMSAAKRSETAKKAALVRWAKKKGKELLDDEESGGKTL